MEKVTIYEFNGGFDIHNEAGHLIRGGFATHGEAALWAKKKKFQIQDIFLVVWENNLIFVVQN